MSVHHFREHVINLRFHFSERSEVSQVVKSRLCKDGARSVVATTKKLFFLVLNY